MTPQFILTGFSDEADPALERQIDMHEALGWQHLELRMVDGIQVDDMADPAFARAVDQLRRRGISVSCLGSAMGKVPLETQPLEADLAILDRLCARATRLGCGDIRIMAYEQGTLSVADWRDRGTARLKALARYAGDRGIRLLLENCVGYATLSGANMTQTLEQVSSPNLQCAFDIGNTVYYGSDPWEYYRAVRPYIAYVHLKDTRKDRTQCYPGEGDAQVLPILSDLYASGYRGFVSIEPHLASTEHLQSDSTVARWEVYRRYGEMTNEIFRDIRRQGRQSSPV